MRYTCNNKLWDCNISILQKRRKVIQHLGSEDGLKPFSELGRVVNRFFSSSDLLCSVWKVSRSWEGLFCKMIKNLYYHIIIYSPKYPVSCVLKNCVLLRQYLHWFIIQHCWVWDGILDWSERALRVNSPANYSVWGKHFQVQELISKQI